MLFNDKKNVADAELKEKLMKGKRIAETDKENS